ncbi:Geranylgeranyl pyrophosphate synthase, chloroplastic/chromoplastic [Senna tora]|uniref:Geranylgeranyl pyrophosphate synthase, chloroplastic/chromoplastic n=1 Tax=Senna tora TaxID=362788 RepID=A0A834WSR8_9FABA|nr:Geranylgeranyl pyrophosphate synthase, chloroplastic/chromoplastic [Senna tora]
MPPQTTEASTNLAVLWVWMYSNSPKLTIFPSLFRSINWPPESPLDPDAAPSSAIACRTRLGETFVVLAAMCWKARVMRESPARIAVSSPKTLWAGGLPCHRHCQALFSSHKFTGSNTQNWTNSLSLKKRVPHGLKKAMNFDFGEGLLSVDR